MKRGCELDNYKPTEVLSESNMTGYKEIGKIQPKSEGVHQQYKGMKTQFSRVSDLNVRNTYVYACVANTSLAQHRLRVVVSRLIDPSISDPMFSIDT